MSAPDPYRLDAFEPHEGTVFTVVNVDQEGGHPIELAEVIRVEPQPGAPRQDPFTLVFAGSTEAYLPQGTYVLRHDDLGDVTIFLVPTGPDAESGRMQYEAVFN